MIKVVGFRQIFRKLFHINTVSSNGMFTTTLFILDVFEKKRDYFIHDFSTHIAQTLRNADLREFYMSFIRIDFTKKLILMCQIAENMGNSSKKILLSLRYRRYLCHLHSSKKALKQTVKFILTLFIADGYRLNSRLN